MADVAVVARAGQLHAQAGGVAVLELFGGGAGCVGVFGGGVAARVKAGAADFAGDAGIGGGIAGITPVKVASLNTDTQV